MKVMTWVFFCFHSNIGHVQLGMGILHGDRGFCLRTLKNWVRGTNAAEEANGEQIALQKTKIYANGICWSLSRLKSNGLINYVQHTTHRGHLQGEILLLQQGYLVGLISFWCFLPRVLVCPREHLIVLTPHRNANWIICHLQCPLLCLQPNN